MQVPVLLVSYYPFYLFNSVSQFKEDEQQIMKAGNGKKQTTTLTVDRELHSVGPSS